MEQYKNNSENNGAEDHFKNGAILKCHTSRRNVLRKARFDVLMTLVIILLACSACDSDKYEFWENNLTYITTALCTLVVLSLVLYLVKDYNTRKKARETNNENSRVTKDKGKVIKVNPDEFDKIVKEQLDLIRKGDISVHRGLYLGDTGGSRVEVGDRVYTCRFR